MSDYVTQYGTPTWWPDDPELIEQIRALVGPLRLRWCPVDPTVKQEAFLRLMGPEAFYGGAAGGGKSVALLAAGAQFLDVPGYKALILRRTYGELDQPEGLMDVARSWWAGTGAHWNERRHRWTFPSGATVTFGYLEKKGSETRYQGGGYHFVGFDELTHFLEHQYLYLHSRTRRPDYENALNLPTSPDGLSIATIPVRLRGAGNPGGVGHEWCYLRFVNSETRDMSVVFIPAKLEDNPYLDRIRYMQSLSHLDAITRRRLLDGDWTVRPDGTLIQGGWFGYLDPDQVPKAVAAARAWDLAATKPGPGAPDPSATVGVRMQRCRDNLFYITDVRKVRDDAGVVERLVKGTARQDGVGVRVGVPKDPGAGGKTTAFNFARRVLRGYVVTQMPTSTDKETRARPFAAAVSNGLVAVVRAPWTADFVREVSSFPHGAHDDELDASADAHTLLTRGGGVRLSKAKGTVRRR